MVMAGIVVAEMVMAGIVVAEIVVAGIVVAKIVMACEAPQVELERARPEDAERKRDDLRMRHECVLARHPQHLQGQSRGLGV